MALTPNTPPENSPGTPADKRKERAAAEEDVLMREVDEAVRQDELSGFIDKYGKPLMGAIVLGLAGFAGYLYWDGEQEASMEKESETLISGLDNLEAGNLDTANTTLTTLSENSEPGAKSAAALLRGGIALEKGQPEEAAKIFATVAGDEDAPQTYRDLATLREIAATYDTRKPEDVIARLKPLAVPGNAYFGSAGEMVAMAYLEQGKRTEAGTLLAEIAKSDDAPDSLRSRARQLAGILGVDAIENVDEVLEETGAADQIPAQ